MVSEKTEFSVLSIYLCKCYITYFFETLLFLFDFLVLRDNESPLNLEFLMYFEWNKVQSAFILCASSLVIKDGK